MSYRCPCCGSPVMDEDPKNITYEICEVCGIEVGYESPEHYPEIYSQWLASGMPRWIDDDGWKMKLNNWANTGLWI